MTIEKGKEIYKSIDLRDQLSEDIRNGWIYKTRKWGLRINKKSVVFDNSFKFKINFSEYHWDGEFEDESYVTLDFYIDDERITTMMMFDDTRWSDRIDKALEEILVYIATYI